MGEEIYKKLNLIKNDDFDKEAVVKYLENQMKDAEWKKVMVDAFERSIKEITESRLANIQKRSNFTKEQCNAKYNAAFGLMRNFAFQVRPKVEILYIG